MKGGTEEGKRRYPRRNIVRRNYMEMEVPDDDHYICEYFQQGTCVSEMVITVYGGEMTLQQLNAMISCKKLSYFGAYYLKHTMF